MLPQAVADYTALLRAVNGRFSRLGAGIAGEGEHGEAEAAKEWVVQALVLAQLAEVVAGTMDGGEAGADRVRAVREVLFRLERLFLEKVSPVKLRGKIDDSNFEGRRSGD